MVNSCAMPSVYGRITFPSRVPICTPEYSWRPVFREAPSTKAVMYSVQAETHALTRMQKCMPHTCAEMYAPHVSGNVCPTRVQKCMPHTCAEMYASHVCRNVCPTRVRKCMPHTCAEMYAPTRLQKCMPHTCAEMYAPHVCGNVCPVICLRGCQQPKAAPRRGIWAADGTPSERFKAYISAGGYRAGADCFCFAGVSSYQTSCITSIKVLFFNRSLIPSSLYEKASLALSLYTFSSFKYSTERKTNIVIPSHMPGFTVFPRHLFSLQIFKNSLVLCSIYQVSNV